MSRYLSEARVVVSESYSRYKPLEILLTAEGMKDVWDAFDRRVPTNKDYRGTRQQAKAEMASSPDPVRITYGFMYYLFYECIEALNTWDEMTKRGLRTPSEHNAYYSNVAEMARQLKIAIESDFELSENFNSKKKSLVDFTDWDCVRNFFGESRVDNDLVGMTRRHSPTVCGLLEKIEEFSEEKLTVGTPSARPTNPNAKAIYLIRRLSAFFREQTGDPWHEAVASILSTLLSNDSIDAIYVQKTADAVHFRKTA